MASRAENHVRVRETASYAKRVSTHIAYALVSYTLMLIFLVAPALESKGMAIWPYFVLVALVAMVILPCRNIERRWASLEERGADLDRHFRISLLKLWGGAIGIPVALMFAARAVS
jgi:cell division protein FtsW (lipid II flippase)